MEDTTHKEHRDIWTILEGTLGRILRLLRASGCMIIIQLPSGRREFIYNYTDAKTKRQMEEIYKTVHENL